MLLWDALQICSASLQLLATFSFALLSQSESENLGFGRLGEQRGQRTERLTFCHRARSRSTLKEKKRKERKEKKKKLVELTFKFYGTASLRRTALASICSPNMAAASQLTLYLNPVITVTRIVSFESRRPLRERPNKVVGGPTPWSYEPRTASRLDGLGRWSADEVTVASSKGDRDPSRIRVNAGWIWNRRATARCRCLLFGKWRWWRPATRNRSTKRCDCVVYCLGIADWSLSAQRIADSILESNNEIFGLPITEQPPFWHRIVLKLIAVGKFSVYSEIFWYLDICGFLAELQKKVWREN